MAKRYTVKKIGAAINEKFGLESATSYKCLSAFIQCKINPPKNFSCNLICSIQKDFLHGLSNHS